MTIREQIITEQEKIKKVINYIQTEWNVEVTQNLINNITVFVWKNKNNYEGNIAARFIGL